MKVALCTDYFYPRIGGVSSHVAGLASELERRHHEVVILTKSAKSDTRYSIAGKVSYLRPSIPIPVILVPPKAADIRDVLERGKFDIVHAHHAFTPTSLLSVSAARKIGMPAVLTNHTIFLASDHESLWVPTSYVLYPFRRYINKANLITAVSQTAADFIGHFTERGKVVVIPNGIDSDRFDSRPCAKEDPMHEVGGGHIILYVGRLVYRKGIHVLVKAMPQILRELPDAQLLIAGEGVMGDFIKLLIKSLDLKDHVKLMGFVPNEMLPDLYGLSQVFVLPSLYCESFGITLLEAMASGKPVVASNVGGVPEVVEDEVTGLLFRKGDERDLADGVLRVMSDHDLALKLAEKARRSVGIISAGSLWPTRLRAYTRNC
ncbi:glycosyltransferase family 4 protein [bacterium]|nr:MAG: glycosyltransferase family 4 protein [bacterium]